MNGDPGKGRILIAEDDPLWRDLLQQVLASLGYEVLITADGEQAWKQILANDRLDVVITDRNMPNLNGMQLLERVRAEPGLQHIPVIFQSAMNDEREVLEGLEAGVFYYLEKPYTLDLMRAVVGSAVADSRRRRAMREDLRHHVHSLQLLRSGQFEIRTLPEARELAAMLASLCPEPEVVANGLSELLINAIEHGNLGITYKDKSALLSQDGWLQEVERRLALPENRDKVVRVELVRAVASITFAIEDQGAGFDWNNYLEIDPARIMHPHGRGIAMARIMSFSSIEYQGRGNRVVATINLAEVNGAALP